MRNLYVDQGRGRAVDRSVVKQTSGVWTMTIRVAAPDLPTLLFVRLLLSDYTF